MGNLCGGSDQEDDKKYRHSIFKDRPYDGVLQEDAEKENRRSQALFEKDQSWFTLSRNNLKKKENQIEHSLEEFFKNPQWVKYKDHVEQIEPQELPVAGGRRIVALYHITPKAKYLTSNKAYIYAHQGGGLMLNAEMFLLEACRTAVLFKTHVFLVDYWKGHDTKAPLGASDFAESIEYINNNSSKFGIHKDHIGVGGSGFGAWVVLGAMIELIKRDNIDIIESAFYVCPIVDDALAKTEDQTMMQWEKKWKNNCTGYFEMMATDFKNQQNDQKLYPLRGKDTNKIFKQMPPSVVFTAEFDYTQRDAMALRKVLEKNGALKDYHQMPGVGHLYHYDSSNAESYWFMKDYSFAFEKYVKKDDELKKIAASFRASAKKLQQ